MQAALCLADEPNASEAVAQTVLSALARQVTKRDGYNFLNTTLTAAVKQLSGSRWASLLCTALAEEFYARTPAQREEIAGVIGNIGRNIAPKDEALQSGWVAEQSAKIEFGADIEAVTAALLIHPFAYPLRIPITSERAGALLSMLTASAPAAHAAARLLFMIGAEINGENRWTPPLSALELMTSLISDSSTDVKAAQYLINILGAARYAPAVETLIPVLTSEVSELRNTAADALGQIGDLRAVTPLISSLNHTGSITRRRAMSALGQIGDVRAVAPLIALLDDEDASIGSAAADALRQIGDARAAVPLRGKLTSPEQGLRKSALRALLRFRGDETDQRLLADSYDSSSLVLDPQEVIGEERVGEAAAELEISEEEVRRRLEALADEFALKLEWRVEGEPPAGRN